MLEEEIRILEAARREMEAGNEVLAEVRVVGARLNNAIRRNEADGVFVEYLDKLSDDVVDFFTPNIDE
jgi:hypothetical protein